MSEKKKSESQVALSDAIEAVNLVMSDAIAESMALDATQRGAVIGGLSAAVQGLDKAVKGLTGTYVPRKKKVQKPS